MAKFVVLFVCFVLIHAGSAIRCYNCQSSPVNDCKDYTKIPLIPCTPQMQRRDAPQPLCIRRILKSATGTNITLQCLDNQTGNECDPPSANYEVTDCKICQEDGCNNSSVITPSLITIFGLFLGYLIVL